MNAKARSLKIENVGDFAYHRTTPRIRLGGHLLEQVGFKPGHRVQMHLSNPGEMTFSSKNPQRPVDKT